jgi:hypothetical protein
MEQGLAILTTNSCHVDAGITQYAELPFNGRRIAAAKLR